MTATRGEDANSDGVGNHTAGIDTADNDSANADTTEPLPLTVKPTTTHHQTNKTSYKIGTK